VASPPIHPAALEAGVFLAV